MSYKEQTVYSGYGSYEKIKTVLETAGAKRPLLVCDSAFDFLFIKDYVASLAFDFVYFNDFKPNPLYEDVEKGVKLYRENNCDFIVSIGGGSAIDVAKCIKLFAKMNDDSLHLKQPYTDSGIPHLAVPTTAGTGSESTRFAVCYYEGAKQSVTHESIIPDYAVLEPQLLKTLPLYQKKATILDAFCQGIESLWSVNSTDESTEYSLQAVETILAFLEPYLEGDEQATAKISVAANLAGKAINITQTTAAHAMSYKITSLYGLSHGHAVAVCLPYVWQYMIENPDKCIDPRGSGHLQGVFDKLCKLFYVDEPRLCVARFFRILSFMELDFPKLGSREDMDILVHSVNPDRLKNNPVQLDEEAIAQIYESVFTDGNAFQKKNIGIFLKRYRLVYDVEQLQQINLQILLNFDEFCKAHGLKYTLGEGTLLGAVRDGGFIPWDDDVDVYMPRDDYEKFVRLTAKNPPAETVLDCFETNPRHWTVCAKLQTKAKTPFTIERIKKLALKNGPSIDVFPLDIVDEKNSAAKFRKVKLLKTMLWLKTGYSHDYSTNKWAFLKLVSLFVPLKAIVGALRKTVASTSESGEYFANFGSLYSGERALFSREWFDGEKTVDFCGHQLPVMHDCEKVLETIYGDYEKKPPYSRRFPKHSYSAFENSTVE